MIIDCTGQAPREELSRADGEKSTGDRREHISEQKARQSREEKRKAQQYGEQSTERNPLSYMDMFPLPLAKIFTTYASICLLVICFVVRQADALSFPTKLGISFSPAGLLTPFHIGAIDELRSMGIIVPDTAVAGASGGALAAVVSALELESEVSLS